MKKLLTVLATLSLACAMAYSTPQPEQIISIGTDIVTEYTKDGKPLNILDKYESATILKVDPGTLIELSGLVHTSGRCGGYFVHDSITEGRQYITALKKKSVSNNYTVQDLPLVKTLISKVEEENIRKGIEVLSSFHNRYYTSQTGVDAAKGLAEYWSKYGPTELYNHPRWKQPSVVTTLTGSKYPDEVIVIGGHLDSIGGFFGGRTAKAPGADDNASGISTITESLRILSEGNYRPLRTIQFIGYAAEEVGLRGSAEIASNYKEAGRKVVGVMQLDMTNYKGSDELIHLTTDYTNKEQTDFLAGLIGTYLKVPFARTRCGYACSDHASWHKNGYPAVFPFEAAKGDMNKRIHTAGDTIEVSGGNANHAVNFAKLAIAYLIELDLHSVQSVNIRP